MEAIRHVHLVALKSLFDELIDRHAEAYIAAYGETNKPGEPCVKEFSPFEKSGTSRFYIGMVETLEFEKPNLKHLKIRGSQTLAKNKTVELDLSVVDSTHSFFPGQIVAFEAFPFQKSQLTVKTFLDPMRIAPPMKTINTCDKINLLISSGPYTGPEQNDWTLLDRLIETIKSENVTHAIFVGPFVVWENINSALEFESKWKLIFSKLIQELFEQPCKIFLVPSCRDVYNSAGAKNHFYPLPKIEFDLNLKDNAKPKCTISSVTDPAQIDLGGLYVDVTAADVLFHFNKCQNFINKGKSNNFTFMFRHIITHGIYPLCPWPSDDNMAVDFLKLERYLQLDRLGPHLIVLPTRFTTAVNNIEDRLAISVGKCSAKKHAVLVTIPKIESSEEEPIKSVVITDYTHRIVPLVVKDEHCTPSSQEVKSSADIEMATASSQPQASAEVGQ